MSDDCCDLVVVTDVELLVITDDELPTLTMIEEIQILEVHDDVTDLVVITDDDILLISDCGIQGPPGPGGSALTMVTAGETIFAWHVVSVDTGLGWLPDNTSQNDVDQVLGIATQNALAGETVPVATDGLLTTGAVFPEGPLYLGLEGALESAVPVSGFGLQIAVAVDPTLLIVRPFAPITLV